MTTDLWNGVGDWNLNPNDWSLEVAPTSSTPAEIQSGQATSLTSGTAQALTIDSGASLLPGLRRRLADHQARA